MGVLKNDGTPYISGVDDIPYGLEHRRVLKPGVAGRDARKESGSAKRRRKAIERREFWESKDA